MSIKINNFEIINNGSQIAIDVETNLGYNIDSILFWTMTSFKDYTLAKDISNKLLKINNKEVLIINANDLNLLKFEDVCFIEITSTYIETEGNCTDCQKATLGIAYSLGAYYTCLLNYLMDLSTNYCESCSKDDAKQIVITINMLIDMTIKALETGYYIQAIDMIAKLKKLCSLKECSGCPTIDCPSCNNFMQS